MPTGHRGHHGLILAARFQTARELAALHDKGMTVYPAVKDSCAAKQTLASQHCMQAAVPAQCTKGHATHRGGRCDNGVLDDVAEDAGHKDRRGQVERLQRHAQL